MQQSEPVDSSIFLLKPCFPLMDNFNDGIVTRMFAIDSMFTSQMFIKVSLSASLAGAELDQTELSGRLAKQQWHTVFKHKA